MAQLPPSNPVVTMGPPGPVRDLPRRDVAPTPLVPVGTANSGLPVQPGQYNPYGDYMGPLALQNAPPYNPYNRTVSAPDIEQAYGGLASNVVETVLIRNITAAEGFWTRDLLPWKKNENSNMVKASVIDFNDHLLDERPSRGLTRVTTSQRTEVSGVMRSYGKSMNLEYNYANTAKGMQRFMLQGQQIANATAMTAFYQVAVALLSAASPERPLQDLMRPQQSWDMTQRLLKSVGLVGCFHRKGGINVAINHARDLLASRGATLSAVVLPSGGLAQIAESLRDPRPDDLAHTFKGDLGGIKVFESMNFRVARNELPDDPFNRTSEYGSYFPMDYDNVANIPLDKFEGDMQSIKAWDEKADDYTELTVEQAARSCGIWKWSANWDFKNPRANSLTDLGRKYAEALSPDTQGSQWVDRHDTVADDEYVFTWKDFVGEARWRAFLNKQLAEGNDVGSKTIGGAINEVLYREASRRPSEKKQKAGDEDQDLSQFEGEDAVPLSTGGGAGAAGATFPSREAINNVGGSYLLKQLAKPNVVGTLASYRAAYLVGAAPELTQDGELKFEDGSREIAYSIFGDTSKFAAVTGETEAEIKDGNVYGMPWNLLGGNADAVSGVRKGNLLNEATLRLTLPMINAFHQLFDLERGAGSVAGQFKALSFARDTGTTTSFNLPFSYNLPRLCLLNGWPVPCNFLAFVPHQRFSVGSMLAVDTNGLGHTYFGHANFLSSVDAQTKMIRGAFSLRLKAMVESPKNVVIIPDVMWRSYISGYNLRRVFNASKAEQVASYKNGVTDGRSVFFCLVPAAWKTSDSVLSLCGELPWIIPEGIDAELGGFPRCHVYRDHWNWHASVDPLQQQHEPRDYENHNTICWRGSFKIREWNGNSAPWGAASINKGPLGQDIYPGSGKVRSGQTAFYKDFSFIKNHD